jgi:Electron transfer DM13
LFQTRNKPQLPLLLKEIFVINLNRLVPLFAIPVAISAISVSGHLPNALANQPISGNGSSAIVAQAQPVAVATGTFVAGEQPTSGTARIVTESGHRYLEFDAAFTTSSQGPDLHVLLDTMPTPPKAYDNTDSGRYINLGGLKSPTGTQRYPIPDSISLGSYKSVVVWCRMANATFGYAPLKPAGTAALPH